MSRGIKSLSSLCRLDEHYTGHMESKNKTMLDMGLTCPNIILILGLVSEHTSAHLTATSLSKYS